MRRRFLPLLLVCLMAPALTARAATGHIVKVLPHFLDLKGRHTLSPSLYERDAYQVKLREHPEHRSGMRFDIQWRVHGHVEGPLKLRVELLGTAKGDLPSKTVLEMPLEKGSWFSRWSSLQFTGDEYHKFGEVTAWRATIWEGNNLLAEQKSFLW
jgi:hypothetical protein